MKAKHKLGTLVQVQREGQPSFHGVVEAVVTRTSGFQYHLENHPESVNETDITKAYREVATRQPRQAKKAATRSRKAATHEHASA